MECSARSLIFHFFWVSLCILLLASLYRLCLGSDPLTFQSLLDSISSMPNVVLSDFSIFNISADWGAFNFLRDFINTLGSITSFGVYITSLFAQVFLVIAWMLGWFFGIA